jgi:hypothetical protein
MAAAFLLPYSTMFAHLVRRLHHLRCTMQPDASKHVAHIPLAGSVAPAAGSAGVERLENFGGGPPIIIAGLKPILAFRLATLPAGTSTAFNEDVFSCACCGSPAELSTFIPGLKFNLAPLKFSDAILVHAAGVTTCDVEGSY